MEDARLLALAYRRYCATNSPKGAVNPFGQVNIALARDLISGELWHIVSDQPTSLQTFREYGERFDIEEEFLDEKSNGFQLEKSFISEAVLLCFERKSVVSDAKKSLSVQNPRSGCDTKAHEGLEVPIDKASIR